MPAKAPPAGYSRLQIRLHWAVAGLVLLQYVLHEGVAQAFDKGIETGAFTLSPAVVGHFAGGGLIFLLAAWRLMLRRERGVPAPPDAAPPWQRALAHGTHMAIYAALVFLPMTGGIAWGTGSTGASTAHEALRAVLLLAILLHAAGAVYGQAVQKSGVLKRMVTPAD